MTTATTWRKERGRETERLAAAAFRRCGWRFAEAVGAGRHGADITGIPGLLASVKATRSCQPIAWLHEVVRWKEGSDGPVAFVIYRPDGMGASNVDYWPVLVRLDEFLRLLRAAGYGDSDADHNHRPRPASICHDCGTELNRPSGDTDADQ